MSLSEPKIYGEERRHQELLAELLHIHLLLEEAVEQAPQTLEIPPFPTTDLTPLQVWLQEVSQRLDRLTPPSPEGIADALARRLPEAPNVSPALDSVADSLKRLDKRIKNLASIPALAMPVGEINGSVTVGNDAGSPIPTNITNPDVRVTNVTAQEIGQGKFNIYGSGRISLSVAGNLRATLKNPATSGKTVKVHRISALGTSTGWATILINPTTGLPASAARPSLNAIVGGGIAGIAEIKADSDTTTALGGGTDTGIVLGIPGGSRTELNLPPLIIAPGVTVGFNVPFAGAADVSLAVYTTEV